MEKRNKKGQFEKGVKHPKSTIDKVIEAATGNTFAKKLSTKELKQQAYTQYCEHLAKGKSKKSWCFKHPQLTLLWETMEKYLREEPDEFDLIKKDVAFCEGYYEWEDVAEKAAKGLNKANTAALQMVMRNKFGWDKEESVNKESAKTEVKELLDSWKKDPRNES